MEGAVFPVGLTVAGKPVAISGDNAEAADKARRLLHAGAHVTLFCPAPAAADLAALLAGKSVGHVGRWLDPHEVSRFHLVLSTRMDPLYNQAVAEACRDARVLVSCYDVPALSDFSMPAMAQRGRLQIAVFTAGGSPALARKIRLSLERLFDDPFVAFLDRFLAALRTRLKREEPDPARRRKALIDAVEGFEIEGTIKYPESNTPAGER